MQESLNIQTTFGYLAQLAQAALDNMEKYRAIVIDMHLGRAGERGKPDRSLSLQMRECVDRYMYLKEIFDREARKSQLQQEMQRWVELAKVHFPNRRLYKNVVELKYALADALYIDLVQLEAIVMNVAREFLKEYDNLRLPTVIKDQKFLDWFWLRGQVVLELVMLDKQANGTTSGILKQRLNSALRGYLITDNTYEMYYRNFLEG